MAESTPTPRVGTGRRTAEQMVSLSRSPRAGRLNIVNHFKKAVADAQAAAKPVTFAKAPARHPIWEFLAERFWPWVVSYLRNIGPRHRFVTYPEGGNIGVYPLDLGEPLRIALAGDWATGTDEAEKIARRTFKPASVERAWNHFAAKYAE